MLVLRRNCGQSIVIGEHAEIIVKVLREENGTISIGIDAPKKMPVDRLEIFEKRLINFYKIDVDLTSTSEYTYPCDSLHAIQVSQEHEYTAFLDCRASI